MTNDSSTEYSLGKSKNHTYYYLLKIWMEAGPEIINKKLQDLGGSRVCYLKRIDKKMLLVIPIKVKEIPENINILYVYHFAWNMWLNCGNWQKSLLYLNLVSHLISRLFKKLLLKILKLYLTSKLFNNLPVNRGILTNIWQRLGVFIYCPDT